MHRETQAPNASRYEAAVGRLADAAVVELEHRQNRLCVLQQRSLDTKIPKRSEVRTHDVSPREKRLQGTLHPREQPSVHRSSRCVMAGDHHAERVAEPLDTIADLLEAFLAPSVRAGTI